MMDGNIMILVTHRGCNLPIRASEKIVWDRMSFGGREKMVKSYREKLRSGKYIKLGNGALVKKDAI